MDHPDFGQFMPWLDMPANMVYWLPRVQVDNVIRINAEHFSTRVVVEVGGAEYSMRADYDLEFLLDGLIPEFAPADRVQFTDNFFCADGVDSVYLDNPIARGMTGCLGDAYTLFGNVIVPLMLVPPEKISPPRTAKAKTSRTALPTDAEVAAALAGMQTTGPLSDLGTGMLLAGATRQGSYCLRAVPLKCIYQATSDCFCSMFLAEHDYTPHTGRLECDRAILDCLLTKLSAKDRDRVTALLTGKLHAWAYFLEEAVCLDVEIHIGEAAEPCYFSYLPLTVKAIP